jgi:hypothetical protein
MRFVIALIAVFSIIFASPQTVSEELNAGSILVAAEQQPTSPAIDVDVDVDRGEWWADPVWLAIGAIALVVLILLIAMAVRGGGTTVIKE